MSLRIIINCIISEYWEDPTYMRIMLFLFVASLKDNYN